MSETVLEKILYTLCPCCVERNIRLCHECRRVIRETEAIYYICNTSVDNIPSEDNNIFCSNNCRAKYLLKKYPNSPQSDSDSSSVFNISRESTPTNYEVVKKKTKRRPNGFDYHEF